MFSTRNGKLICLITAAHAKQDLMRLACKDTDFFLKKQPWKTESGAPAPGKMGVLTSGDQGRRFSNLFHWKDRANVSKPHWKNGKVADEMSSLIRQLELWRRNPQSGKNAVARLQRLHNGAEPKQSYDRQLFQAAQLHSAFRSVNNFPATVAMFFCNRLQPQKVLDFSAGWGDRLTAFLACTSVRDIVLIDPRASAAAGYRGQAQLAAKMGLRKKVRVHSTGAETALPKMARRSPGYFDMIFTSPPYFNLENYDTSGPNAALQAINKHGDSLESFLHGFMFPCLDACMRLLSPNGVLILNIDDNSRQNLKYCDATLQHMRQQGAHFVGTMGMLKPSMGKSEGSTAQPIYVWARNKSAMQAARRALMASSAPPTSLPLACGK